MLILIKNIYHNILYIMDTHDNFNKIDNFDNVNFFSNTNPDLIGSATLKNLNNNIVIADKPKMTTLSESSVNFYKKYIQPNLIPIIIVVIFIGIMIYRYMTRKNDLKLIENEDDSSEPSNSENESQLSNKNTHNKNTHNNNSSNTHIQNTQTINNTINMNELDNVIDQYIKSTEYGDLIDQMNNENTETTEKDLYIDSNLNILDYPYKSDFIKFHD